MSLDPVHLIQAAGLLGVFLIIFAETGLFFGFFLPGDSLLVPIGILAAQGYIDPINFAMVATLGAILGDSVGYFIGRRFGPSVFRKEDSFFFDKKHIERAELFYKKYGPLAVFLARFTPIVRTFVPSLAGVGHMRYRIFLFWNIIGGIVWPASLIWFGYFFGSRIPNIDAYIVPGVIAIVILFALPVIYQALKRVFSGKKL